MKTSFFESPRRFDPDGSSRFSISDMGSIKLEDDELITFVAETGSEYDVTRKSWGYYATPSLDHRLPAKGLRPVLASNKDGHYYICLIELSKEIEFAKYFDLAGMRVVGWLDDQQALVRIEIALRER